MLARPFAQSRRGFRLGAKAVLFFGISVALAAPHGCNDAHASKLVGTGAAGCRYFLREAANNPTEVGYYLAWAQGYMSAILMSSPPDVDDDLDLGPTKMPLREQIAFLSRFCAANPQRDYVDAVHALYGRLGGMALR